MYVIRLPNGNLLVPESVASDGGSLMSDAYVEIGHALDDLDGAAEQWQSDSEEFQALYGQCLPYMASAFHRHPGLLGRREFFADAFAAIASRQRPALVEMLGGDTRSALNVMLYFNVRYGI